MIYRQPQENPTMTRASRTQSGWPTEREHGPKILSISASRVTSNQLKQYLDEKYPGQYSVQLKRDQFTITLTRNGKEQQL
ncbi:uncharacterized protein F4812DRAFT_439613 [Daldinia caldariorum]|uniref:uncharacterized protein n=1 Tax=Daldinia caldariorum TaxID=326644 RepID=UPI002007CEE6|nr:uncharacterized protein F4812DRAFT_439613 [Daldinia caldariorum]KAI1465109.1 hypothetical protein F4812DRAFT_439613 [Daldinia caldariorum]